MHGLILFNNYHTVNKKAIKFSSVISAGRTQIQTFMTGMQKSDPITRRERWA